MVMTRHSLGVASLRSVLGEDRLEPFHFLFQFREQVANADAIIVASFDLEQQRDFRSAFRVQGSAGRLPARRPPAAEPGR